MQISYLKIQNFRNIAEMEIYPSPYINIITGDNGSGKSSILYALMYAITDKLPEKLSNYIMWGKDYFFIEIHFKYLDRFYKLNVKHDGNKTIKSLEFENDIYYNSEVTKYLNNLFNTNLIYYSLFSEQGKTSQILFDTPANRLKKLKEILNIDVLNEVCDNIKEDINKEKDEIIKIETQLKIAKEKTFTFHKLPQLPDIIEIQKQFDILQKEKEQYDSDVEKYVLYKNKKEKYDFYILQKKEIESNIFKLKQEIDSLHNNFIYTPYDEKISELQNQIYDIQNKKFDLEKNLLNADENIKLLNNYKLLKENKEKEIKSLIVKRLVKLPFTEDDLQNILKQINSLQYELNDIEKQIALVEKGKCPTCGRDFHGFNIEELKLNLKKLKEQKAIYDLDYKNKLNTYENYKYTLSENEKIIYKKNLLEDDLKNLNSDIENINKKISEINIKEIKEQIQEYNNLLISLNQDIRNNLDLKKQQDIFLSDIEQKKILLNSYIHNLNQLENQYIGYTNEPEFYPEPKKYNELLYNELQNKIQEYNSLKSQYEILEKLNTQILEDKNKNDNLIKELQQKYEDLTSHLELLKECHIILDKQFSSYLIDTGAQYLKEYMNKFFISTYGKYEITFSQDKNSIDFYFGDGDTFTSCAMASGFEKSCISVALRVALASLIPSFLIMILDEIDSDASSNNSIQMYKMLLEFLPHHQFFIITHIDETKDFLLQNYQSNFYTINKGLLINK